MAMTIFYLTFRFRFSPTSCVAISKVINPSILDHGADSGFLGGVQTGGA